jgi:hypothetical protein
MALPPSPDRCARRALRGVALAAALAPLAAGLLPACQATRVGTAETLEEAIATYRASDEKKAFALAVDEDGRRRWGAQYGSLDQDRAVADAMEECQRSAQRSGVTAQCFLFAVGDREPRATLDGCRSHRINERRCAAQSKYGPLLVP